MSGGLPPPLRTPPEKLRALTMPWRERGWGRKGNRSEPVQAGCSAAVQQWLANSCGSSRSPLR
eukprot:4377815-Alexandrium_andersonii.AAC.1